MTISENNIITSEIQIVFSDIKFYFLKLNWRFRKSKEYLNNKYFTNNLFIYCLFRRLEKERLEAQKMKITEDIAEKLAREQVSSHFPHILGKSSHKSVSCSACWHTFAQCFEHWRLIWNGLRIVLEGNSSVTIQIHLLCYNFKHVL